MGRNKPEGQAVKFLTDLDLRDLEKKYHFENSVEELRTEALNVLHRIRDNYGMSTKKIAFCVLYMASIHMGIPIDVKDIGKISNINQIDINKCIKYVSGEDDTRSSFSMEDIIPVSMIRPWDYCETIAHRTGCNVNALSLYIKSKIISNPSLLNRNPEHMACIIAHDFYEDLVNEGILEKNPIVITNKKVETTEKGTYKICIQKDQLSLLREIIG